MLATTARRSRPEEFVQKKVNDYLIVQIVVNGLLILAVSKHLTKYPEVGSQSDN